MTATIDGEAVDASGYLAVLRSAYSIQYADQSDEWTDDLAMRCLPALVQGSLKLPRSVNALDIGCGAGRDVEYLSNLLDSVTGIDILSHRNWDRIRNAKGPGVRFAQTDLLSHPTNELYGLILDNGCFHHQHPTHYSAYLGRVSRLMLGGGHFVLSTFKNPTRRDYLDANGRLHKYFGDDELRQLLDAAGLEVAREMDIYRVTKHDYYRLSFCRQKAVRR